MLNMQSPEDRAGLGAAGMAAGLGCSIVVSIIIFIAGGVMLDRLTDRSPVFTLIGVAVALLVAGYQLYELAQVGRVDRAPGPVSRQIARMPVARRPSTGGATGRTPAAPREGEEE